jgi:rRNA small subunit aminocarboxypropyltransferase
MPQTAPTNPPITILVVHPRENRAKCSLEPLRGRADLRFVKFAPQLELDLGGYVRLAVDGEPLTAADRDRGLLLLDGNWRRADPMNRAFARVPGRSLRGFKTAYPRTSKLRTDPAEGLASVEALYIALTILGRPTEGLLDGYRWRSGFLAANGWGETNGTSRPGELRPRASPPS